VNLDGHHLPPVFKFVPAALWWSSAFFFLLSIGATYFFSVLYAGRSNRLHCIVVGCISLKSLTLAAKWKCINGDDKMGYATPRDVQIYQLSAHVYSIVDMVMYLLVAMGWKIFQSHLSLVQSRFVTIIVTTSLIISLWSAVGGPSTDANFSLMLAINLMLCYLATTLTMRANLDGMNRQLGDFQLESMQECHIVEFLYERRKKFLVFRRVFMARVLEAFFPWKVLEACVGEMGVFLPTVSAQVALAAIYVVLSWVVAPVPRNSRSVALLTMLADSDESNDDVEESSNSWIFNDVDYWTLGAGDFE
jgi:hypothetical protein